METLLQYFQALHPRRWFTGLWLNSDFRKLWGSLTIVHFGGQITFLALPLTAAIALNASPFEVGVLTALLRFFEDSSGRSLIPDMTSWGAFGSWLGAWSNWLGFVLFLGLALAVYLDAKRARVDD